MPTFWLSALSKLLVLATLILLYYGAMVTSVGAGMSVPDWPTSFGHQMLALPFTYWVGPVYWEHTHRVLGKIVGTISIFLTVFAWIQEPRRWVRYLVTATLLLIIVQGLMGGFRVTEGSIPLAIVHGCLAQICFCLVVWTAIVYFKNWDRPVSPALTPERLRTLRRWAWSLTAVILVQLVLGAIMRHIGAGLAIPTFPLTPDGRLMPSVHSMEVDIHFSHRVWAVVVMIVGGITVTKIFRSKAGENRLTVPAALLSFLLLVQFTLGASIILLAREAVPTTLHVIVGAIILVLSFVMAIRTSAFQRRLAAGNGAEAQFNVS